MDIVQSFHLMPGCCALCRSEAHPPAIDTHKDLDQLGFEGRCYICRACVVEMGGMMGMVEADHVSDLTDDALASDLAAMAWEERALAAEAALSAMNRHVDAVKQTKPTKARKTAKKVPA